MGQVACQDVYVFGFFLGEEGWISLCVEKDGAMRGFVCSVFEGILCSVDIG